MISTLTDRNHLQMSRAKTSLEMDGLAHAMVNLLLWIYSNMTKIVDDGVAISLLEIWRCHVVLSEGVVRTMVREIKKIKKTTVHETHLKIAAHTTSSCEH